MATSIKGVLSSFTVGETKRFGVLLTLDGDNPNITNDTVTFYLLPVSSSSIDDALLTVDADVTTNGADGRADFVLLAADTADLAWGVYHYKFKWIMANGDVKIFPDDPYSVTVYQV